LALAADRSVMLDGDREGDDRPPATIRLTRRQRRLVPDVQRLVAASPAVSGVATMCSTTPEA
jgi:hypothetical protein